MRLDADSVGISSVGRPAVLKEYRQRSRDICRDNAMKVANVQV